MLLLKYSPSYQRDEFHQSRTFRFAAIQYYHGGFISSNRFRVLQLYYYSCRSPNLDAFHQSRKLRFVVLQATTDLNRAELCRNVRHALSLRLLSRHDNGLHACTRRRTTVWFGIARLNVCDWIGIAYAKRASLVCVCVRPQTTSWNRGIRHERLGKQSWGQTMTYDSYT
jgi:hypothetical protein